VYVYTRAVQSLHCANMSSTRSSSRLSKSPAEAQSPVAHNNEAKKGTGKKNTNKKSTNKKSSAKKASAKKNSTKKASAKKASNKKKAGTRKKAEADVEDDNSSSSGKKDTRKKAGSNKKGSNKKKSTTAQHKKKDADDEIVHPHPILGVINENALYSIDASGASVSGQQLRLICIENDINCMFIRSTSKRVPSVVMVPDDVYAAHKTPYNICHAYSISQDLVERLRQNDTLFVPFTRALRMITKDARHAVLYGMKLKKNVVTAFDKKNESLTVLTQGPIFWYGNAIDAESVCDILRDAEIVPKSAHVRGSHEKTFHHEDHPHEAIVVGSVHDFALYKNHQCTIVNLDQLLVFQPVAVEKRVSVAFRKLNRQVQTEMYAHNKQTHGSTAGWGEKERLRRMQEAAASSGASFDVDYESDDCSSEDEHDDTGIAHQVAGMQLHSGGRNSGKRTGGHGESDMVSWTNHLIF
jgi:hypothetical protein